MWLWRSRSVAAQARSLHTRARDDGGECCGCSCVFMWTRSVRSRSLRSTLDVKHKRGALTRSSSDGPGAKLGAANGCWLSLQGEEEVRQSRTPSSDRAADYQQITPQKRASEQCRSARLERLEAQVGRSHCQGKTRQDERASERSCERVAGLEVVDAGLILRVRADFLEPLRSCALYRERARARPGRARRASTGARAVVGRATRMRLIDAHLSAVDEIDLSSRARPEAGDRSSRRSRPRIRSSWLRAIFVRARISRCVFVCVC